MGKLLQESSASVSHLENGEREDNTTCFGGGVVAVGNEGTEVRKLLGRLKWANPCKHPDRQHVGSAQYTGGAGLFLSRTQGFSVKRICGVRLAPHYAEDKPPIPERAGAAPTPTWLGW